MPKIKRFVPAEQKAWEDELRDRYGGMMTRRQIGIELGHGNNYRWVNRFVEDLRAYGVTNGYPRYKVSDVAEKIYLTM